VGSLAAETVDRVGRFLEGHPGVLPVMAVLLVVSVVASGPLAHRVGCGRLAAAALLLACTAPLALTLPPATDRDAEVVTGCALAVKRLAEWGRGGEELANLVMLAPAGALLVALLRRRAAVVAILAATAFPVAVEAVQLLAPALRRSCESTDVLLNLAGLAAGVLAGVLVRLVRRPVRTASRATGPRPGVSRGT